MTESRYQQSQSFMTDNGAALEQAMGLLQQKGLIIEKYMQKMGEQQTKIQQLMEEIERLNWQNRQRQYNQQTIRKINVSELIQQGFVQFLKMESQQQQVQNGISKQHQGEHISSSKRHEVLTIVRILVDTAEGNQIVLNSNMQLFKDNLTPIDNNQWRSVKSEQQSQMNNFGRQNKLNTSKRQQKQRQQQNATKAYCLQVLKQLQLMKQQLSAQDDYYEKQIDEIKQQNTLLIFKLSQLKTQTQQAHKAHSQQLIIKQQQLQSTITKYQQALNTIKQSGKKVEQFMTEQTRQLVLKIGDLNSQISNQKFEKEKALIKKEQEISLLKQQLREISCNKVKQLQEKDKLIGYLQTEIEQIKCKNKEQEEKYKNRILQLEEQIQKQKQKQKDKQSDSNQLKQLNELKQSQNIHQSTQTDPELVLDIDFLRHTKLQINKKRQQLNQMILTPIHIQQQNHSQNTNPKMKQNLNDKQQSEEHKICLPPSLDVITFDFEQSVSSSGNMSPGRKFSNKSSSEEFYINERKIEEMYSIPKERHHRQSHTNHNNIGHIEKERKEAYLSQPNIPHEQISANHYQQEQIMNKNKQSSSENQSDRIRVTPESVSELANILQRLKEDKFIENDNQTKKDNNITRHLSQQHQQRNKDLLRLPQMQQRRKVVSYSQRNIIVQQTNQDQQHLQQQKRNYNSHQQPLNGQHQQKQHKINYVNVMHHYHHQHHRHQHHYQQEDKFTINQHYHKEGKQFIMYSMVNTAKDLTKYDQQNQDKMLKKHPSDDDLPERSVLSCESSASSIRVDHNTDPHKIISNKEHFLEEEKIGLKYFDNDDGIRDQGLENSDHPSETYKNSLRFPHGYCSGSMDKIHHQDKTHQNIFQNPRKLSKSIGYNFTHQHGFLNHNKHNHRKNKQIFNAKQLLEMKSPQNIMKSLIDKSFPIQKNPFKLSNQFINVAELMKEENRDKLEGGVVDANDLQNKNVMGKMDYLGGNLNKKGNGNFNKSSAGKGVGPGSDSFVNILIESNQEDQHQSKPIQIQQKTLNPFTQQNRNQQNQNIEKNVKQANDQKTQTKNKIQSGFKTPRKHKTIELAQSLDFESLKKIQIEVKGQQIGQGRFENKQQSTKSKKKPKIIYLRR